jgi:hypothetical protein
VQPNDGDRSKESWWIANKASLGNKCSMWRNGRFHIVMPTQVSIHVFSSCWPQRRGWPAFASHDEATSGAPEMIRLFPLGPKGFNAKVTKNTKIAK